MVRTFLPKRWLIASAIAFVAGWPLPAFASTWMLVSSTISGTNWVCTYQSPDHRFETTLVMPTGQMCPSFINR